MTGTYSSDFKPSSLSVNGVAIPLAYDNDGLLTQAGALALGRDAQNGLLTATTTTSQSYTTFGEVSQLTAAHSGSTLLNAQRA